MIIEPPHQIMVLFILHKLILHAQPSSGARCLIFGRTLHLLPFFMCANSDCCGEAHSLVAYVGRVKRIWYLPPMRAAKVQASLCIYAVFPESPLLARKSSESRGTFRQKARSLAPLKGWACAVKICHVGMFKDTNSLDGPRDKYHNLMIWLKWKSKYNEQSLTFEFQNSSCICTILRNR